MNPASSLLKKPFTHRYECSAVNEYGRATAQAVVRIRQPEATDVLVIRAFKDAKEEIDRAINNTLTNLFSGDRSQRVNPFRLARFPDAVGRAAARPAEIFERTLVNIRRMVNAGIATNNTSEFRYEEILTPDQVTRSKTLRVTRSPRNRHASPILGQADREAIRLHGPPTSAELYEHVLPHQVPYHRR